MSFGLPESASEQSQQFALLGQEHLLLCHQLGLLLRQPLQSLENIAITSQPHQGFEILTAFQALGNQSWAIQA